MKKSWSIAASLGALATLTALACTTEGTSTPAGGDAGARGDGGAGATGVVVGPKDAHCGAKKQTTTAAACHPDAGGGHSHGTDAGHSHDTDAGGGASEYGETQYNDEADDDECKYHLKWSASGVAQNQDVSFTVALTAKAGGAAVRAAPIRAEVFLDDTHPGPNTNQTSSETATAGTYAVGPIRFDKPGKWTVRFHVFEECSDGLESPHGHVAFFVEVP